MNSWAKLNKNESGQAALEAAIILIAFVVVASVFAFAVLSAGSASTARGEQAIYSGLQQVQASLEVKGAVIAHGTTGVGGTVTDVIFTVAPVSGGDPINLDPGAKKVVTISYLDAIQRAPDLTYTVKWLVTNQADIASADNLLESGELAQITVTGIAAENLAANTPFSLEIKPPTGAVVQINRTTPAALALVMTLR